MQLLININPFLKKHIYTWLLFSPYLPWVGIKTFSIMCMTPLVPSKFCESTVAPSTLIFSFSSFVKWRVLAKTFFTWSWLITAEVQIVPFTICWWSIPKHKQEKKTNILIWYHLHNRYTNTYIFWRSTFLYHNKSLLRTLLHSNFSILFVSHNIITQSYNLLDSVHYSHIIYCCNITPFIF